MKPLSPSAAKQRQDTDSGTVCFVDVRSQDEFNSGHVPGAACIPLDQIAANQAVIPKDKLVVLNCQAGKRSAEALQLLRARGFTNIVEIEGGFAAWAAAGLPIQRSRKAIPIMRQVLLTAGVIVLAGSVLALTVHPRFVWVPLLIGAGLAFAGATGWCGLAYLLERMPWNKS